MCGTTRREFYDVQELSMGVNILVLGCFSVGMRLIAYLILRRGGPKFDKSI